MAQTDPLLLLDNGTLAYIIGNGDYRFTNIKFEEARASIDMGRRCGAPQIEDGQAGQHREDRCTKGDEFRLCGGLFLSCAWRRTFLTGESPESTW